MSIAASTDTAPPPSAATTARRATTDASAAARAHRRLAQAQDIEVIGRFFGLAFQEELWSAKLVEVLADKASRVRFLTQTSISDTELFVKAQQLALVEAWELNDAVLEEANALPKATDGTTLIDEAYRDMPAGAMFYDSKGFFNAEAREASWKAALRRGLADLDAENIARIRAQAQRLATMEADSWVNKACPEGAFYVHMIAVNPLFRGRGVFSALLDPLLAKADAQGKTVCLEAYATHLLPLYEHKGFRLHGSIAHPGLGIVQYQMIRSATR